MGKRLSKNFFREDLWGLTQGGVLSPEWDLSIEK
jgi:hypothetical protein